MPTVKERKTKKAVPPAEIRRIPIENILVSASRREIEHAKVHELAESIHEVGLLNPITVTRDMQLVAGGHRLEACKAIGWHDIACTFLEGDSLHVELAEIDENLIRNDLDAISVGELALRRDDILEALGVRAKVGQGRPSKNGAESAPLKTTKDIAKEIGVSERALQVNKQLARDLVPEAKEVIRKEDIPKTVALEISRLEPEQQREVIAKDDKKAILAASKEIRKEMAEQRRAKRTEQIVEAVQNNKPLDGSLGTFAVIYADPPWAYDSSESDMRVIENHYPTMTLEEICKLDVKGIAHDDAVLFLWTTSPKLQEAFQVLAAWDFDYRTCAVWDKEKIGMGYYFRQQHELLLVATRGKVPAPMAENRPSSMIRSPRSEHSRKPDSMYDIIEAMYPRLPKIELFARNERSGWSRWGNQS